ncbi:hypothetical protein BST81_04020 [Leptolyngbya sp. 'hensonii']|uniref:hypothetical protein n=1 Tax=Leptolyngbya sp. 'hensonii' TaxID=1922337 RepID=UPI00094FBB1D|nr:hypothetical protein [Leptolyngbya sp. 'hensonii']OLP19714.1 hypothetical protein BST81_04020 [Leptolyngbya sp. 'hensonii']
MATNEQALPGQISWQQSIDKGGCSDLGSLYRPDRVGKVLMAKTSTAKPKVRRFCCNPQG